MNKLRDNKGRFQKNPPDPYRFIVYGLVDPATEEIRYIGKSCHGVSRFTEHLWPSAMGKGNDAKDEWIRSLLYSGKKPNGIVLKVCTNSDDVALGEKEMISLYRSKGANLLNIAEGGVGGNTGRSYMRWKPVVSKNIITGKEKEYRYVWETVNDGFEATKVVAVCKGTRKVHKGHLFRYKDSPDFAPYIISPSIKRIRIKINSTDEIQTFDSVKEAAKALGIRFTTLDDIARRRYDPSQYSIEFLAPKPKQEPVVVNYTRQ